MKEFMQRFKSWALWLSIGSLVVFCVKEFAGVDISETVNGFLNVLLPKAFWMKYFIIFSVTV